MSTVYAFRSGYVMRDPPSGELWFNEDGSIEYATDLSEAELAECREKWPEGVALIRSVTPTATADLARIGGDFDVAAAMKASQRFAAERIFILALAKRELCSAAHGDYSKYEGAVIDAALSVAETSK